MNLDLDDIKKFLAERKVSRNAATCMLNLAREVLTADNMIIEDALFEVGYNGVSYDDDRPRFWLDVCVGEYCGVFAVSDSRYPTVTFHFEKEMRGGSVMKVAVDADRFPFNPFAFVEDVRDAVKGFSNLY